MITAFRGSVQRTDAAAINSVMQEFDKVMAGRAEDVGRLIRGLSSLSTNLAGRKGDIDRLITASDKLSRAVDERRDALGTSVDGGRTWANIPLPGVSILAGGEFQRVTDPWVDFGPSNRVYAFSLGFDDTGPDNGLFVSTSTDGGLTWGAPVPVIVDRQFEFFNDKNALAVDDWASSPNRGNVYLAWTQFTDESKPPSQIMFARSLDCGATWSKPFIVGDNSLNQGVTMAIDPATGSVYLAWRRFKRHDLLRRAFDYHRHRTVGAESGGNWRGHGHAQRAPRRKPRHLVHAPQAAARSTRRQRPVRRHDWTARPAWRLHHQDDQGREDIYVEARGGA